MTEYSEPRFMCPNCGKEFERDPMDYYDSFAEGRVKWDEFRHECECGAYITYKEVYEFKCFEVEL